VKNVKSYVFPETIDEAIEILTASDSSRIVAGGTWMIFNKDYRIETLVDITRLGLDYIKEDGEFIKIGATTTIARMLESPVLSDLAGGILADAGRRVANSHVRELITVGGDLGSALPWCDLPPAFLVLDAIAVIYDGKEKEIPLTEFYKDRSARKKSDLDFYQAEILRKV